MRWNKKFDGTKESLLDKSHRPHSRHPKAHTDIEMKHIKNYIKKTLIYLCLNCMPNKRNIGHIKDILIHFLDY